MSSWEGRWPARSLVDSQRCSLCLKSKEGEAAEGKGFLGKRTYSWTRKGREEVSVQREGWKMGEA